MYAIRDNWKSRIIAGNSARASHHLLVTRTQRLITLSGIESFQQPPPSIL